MATTAKQLDLRSDMPETANWVDRMRVEMGKPHVNECIRRALAGEPGYFYAMERGQVLGTPFPATHPIHDDQRLAIILGCKFAAFIREPKKAQHGTN